MPRDGSMYLTPLTRGLLPTDFNLRPEKIIAVLAKELGRRLRARLRQSAFSDRAKRAFANAMKIKAGPSSVTLIIDHPGWRPAIKGQRKGPMSWLLKARRPIPILLKDGTLIFRNATAKSFENGSWVHPGREQQHFIEKAKQEVKDQLRKKIRAEVRKFFTGK